MVITSMERGRRLEARIGDFFTANGYSVQLNAVIEGRSGGRHEIDVLAEKSDALTTFRVGVECKAWETPIEKDVVSKLHYVLGDLGLNKGIIASLGGIRSGAQTAADELGIELWGPEELRRHLGDELFADVSDGQPRPGTTTGLAYPFTIRPEAAQQAIRTAGKGRFGVRTIEELVWFVPVWFPAFVIRMTVAQPGSSRFRGQLRSTIIDNVYEALSGAYLGSLATPPGEVDLGSAVRLAPIMRETQLHSTLRAALQKRQKVTSPAAIERHDQYLRSVGLPLPCASFTIDETWRLRLPLYVGVLRSGGQDRAVAVNGGTGISSNTLSQVLTSNLAGLRAAFGG